MVLEILVYIISILMIIAGAFVLEDVRIALLSLLAFFLVFLIIYLIQVVRLTRKGYKRKKIKFLRSEVIFDKDKEIRQDVYETIEKNPQIVYHRNILFKGIWKTKYAYCLKGEEAQFANSLIISSLILVVMVAAVGVFIGDKIKWKSM